MGLTTRHRGEFGVSTAEILAALAITLVLALILWPKTIRSARAANEASSIVTLKEIGQAEMTYAATYPAIGFAESLNQLGGLNEPCSPTPARACLLAEVARSPFTYRGYSFSATGHGIAPRTSFLSLSVPLRIGDSGQLSFCSTNRWLIHYRADGQSIPDAETCDGLPLLR